MSIIFNYLSVAVVVAGAVILSLSFPPAVKISRNLRGRIRRTWMTVVYLIGLFIACYISFDIILIVNYRFPVELIAGCVFLGVSVFVYIIINVSRSTIAKLKRIEDKLFERVRYAQLGSDISAAFVKQEDLEIQLRFCAESVAENLGAAFAGIWLPDEKNESILKLIASAGMCGYSADNIICEKKISMIIKEKKPYLTNEVTGDPMVEEWEWVSREGIIAFAGYPFVLSDSLLGLITVFSRKPLQEGVLEVLALVSAEITLGIARKKAEERIHYLAYYDSLTGLPNRFFFRELLKRSIEYAVRYKHSYAIAIIDLDDFSRINDTLGHDTGDELLQIASSRLLNALRSSDFIGRIEDNEEPVARMGGDEFIVLLQEVNNVMNVSTVAGRILKELSQSYKLGSREIFITASIGIAVYPDNGGNVENLIKNCDTALYHAKKKGKNNFQFYSESMNEAVLEHLTLESSLRRAIEHREFLLYYQPKVDIATGKISGAEALIRWKTADGDLIPPMKFIPVAEENGLIIPIGSIVLQDACLQNKIWQEAFPEKISVAINVSGKQFGQKYFVHDVLAALGKAGLDPRYLDLEITETTIMIDPEGAVRSLNELKEAGIQISLDDFGTGYSSLSYLRRLPLDTLKIDISFIRDVVTNPNDAAIVKAIIALAKNLNLNVIAEGVEDEQQLKFLKEHKCDIVQGYLYSPPVPAEEFYGLLTRRNVMTRRNGLSA